MFKLFAKGCALCAGAAATLMLSGCVGIPYAGDGYATDYNGYDGYDEPYYGSYGAPAVVAPSVSLGIYGNSYDRGPVYRDPYPRGYYPRRRYYPVPVPVPTPGYGARPNYPGYGAQPSRPGRPGRPDRPNRPGRPGPGFFPNPGTDITPLPVPGARVPERQIPEAAKDPFGRNSGTGH